MPVTVFIHTQCDMYIHSIDCFTYLLMSVTWTERLHSFPISALVITSCDLILKKHFAENKFFLLE